jgi:hypothetical protein
VPLIPTNIRVGDVTGAARGAIGFSRANRLRQDMDRTLALYDQATKMKLDKVASDLEGALSNQSAQLLYISEPSRPRKWDWGGFLASSILTLVIAVPGWLVWSHVSHPWYAYIIALPYAFLVFVATWATLANLFERRDEPPAGNGLAKPS